MRLNQFVAHAGVCARRKADLLVAAGEIAVNGTPIYSPAYRVEATDQVTYRGRRLLREPLHYLLLHKPPRYVTTLHDPQGRRRVLDLLRPAKRPRIYPVGRLDCWTEGLLLLTNDGWLARQLAHPSKRVPKRYMVRLQNPLTREQEQAVRKGVPLEDGIAHVDALTPLDRSRFSCSLTLHSGRNRIIRRLFAALGQQILRLQRTHYAGLTCDHLPAGAYRELTTAEVSQLYRWGDAPPSPVRRNA